MICVVNYAVDFIYFLHNRYCRFHIGCWDENTWEKAIKHVAMKWLHRTPTVKITDNSRYMLIDIIQGKYRSSTIQSWQKAALLLAMSQSHDTNQIEAARSTANAYINNNGEWKVFPIAVDCGMLSYAILELARDKDNVKPAMDYSLKLIEKNVNRWGMISYTGGIDNYDMYVDTIGLAVPFLFAYSRYYRCSKYERIGLENIRLFRKWGLLKETNLPNHAFNVESKLPLGVYGWGRGVGWYIIGLVDSYRMAQEQQSKDSLIVWIQEAAQAYLNFQREDGGFGSILQSSKTYDSSATAVLAWFYAYCSKLFDNEQYLRIANKCLKKLLTCTRINGAIDLCQGDTKGIGIFAQTYDIMPFAQGMTLRAIYTLKNDSSLQDKQNTLKV